MGRKSRFDDRFREQAVELARTSVKPMYVVAADLGISSTTLGKWMSTRTSSSDEPLSVTEREELDRLRSERKTWDRDRREWAMEREILKKATAFWVKESNA